MLIPLALDAVAARFEADDDDDESGAALVGIAVFALSS